MRPRRTATALLATVTLALAGACSSGGSGPGAAGATGSTKTVQAVLNAATTTRDAGTSKIDLGIDTVANGRKVDITGTGAFDYGKGVGELTLTLPKEAGATKADEIITKDALYLQVGQLTKGKYLKVDLGQLSGVVGQLGGGDPTASLDALQGVSSDVRKTGKEQVRGTDTTHYTGTIDLQRALAKVPPASRQRIQALLSSNGPTAVPFDAYLDDQGRLRRLVTRVEATAPANGAAPAAPLAVTTTIDLYDFGTPVSVQVPSPDQVVDGSGRPAGGRAVPGGSASPAS